MNRQNTDCFERHAPSLPSLLALLSLLLASPLAHAFDLQIHGFADVVGSKSNTQYPVDNLGNHGNHLTLDPESNLGINLSAELGENFTFFGQVLGEGDEGGHYSMEADWLFLNYRPIEALTIRAGRQILPAFLYSEQLDVGFTLLWTRLPFEVYGLYPLRAFSGLSVYYKLFFGDFQLRATIFGGAGDSSISAPGTDFVVYADNTKGAELKLSSDHLEMRAGYVASNPSGTFTTKTPLTATPAGTVSGLFTGNTDLGTAQLFSAGASFDYLKFVGTGEFTYLTMGGSFVHAATAAYLSLGYRVHPKLTPYFMYAWQGNLNASVFTFPDPAVSTTWKKDQHAETMGLNFKLTPSAAIKAEYMRTQVNFVDSNRDYGVDTFTGSVDLVF